MRKRFVARRRNDILVLKIVGIAVFLFVVYFLIVKPLFRLQIRVNSSNLLAVASNNMIGEAIFQNDINIPLVKAEYLFGVNISSTSFSQEVDSTQYVVHPVEVEVPNTPLVYIYNTHPQEEYSPGNLSVHNITPNVVMASHMLQKALTEKGISAIVEENDVRNIINSNGWKFSDSYRASRQLIEKAIVENPSLKYFVDLHRDSTSGSVVINEESYAKMMMVIGTNHSNYKANEALILNIDGKMREYNSELMRRVSHYQNSRFNQDLNEGVFLVEVGSPTNTIEEVYNSIQILADAIAKTINGEY